LSTERFSLPFAVASGAGVLFLATYSASAAEVDFHPALSFGVFHDGNISVTRGGSGDDDATLALDLE